MGSLLTMLSKLSRKKFLTDEEFRSEYKKHLTNTTSSVRIYGWDKEIDDSLTIGILPQLKPYVEVKAIVRSGEYNPKLKEVADGLKEVEKLLPLRLADGSLQFVNRDDKPPTLFKVIDENHLFCIFPTNPKRLTNKMYSKEYITVTSFSGAFDQLYSRLP